MLTRVALFDKKVVSSLKVCREKYILQRQLYHSQTYSILERKEVNQKKNKYVPRECR